MPLILRIPLLLALTASVTWGQNVDFNRDVRPILAAHCYACHGPDAAAREAGLRLDLEADSRRDLGGYAALVPHDPARSDLWTRVITEDMDEIMPPVKSKKPLTAAQKATLKRWIEQGAAYQTHWAYVRPIRPSVPASTGDIQNPIDAFIRQRLPQAGLEPSPEADASRLIRRVSLDLTGLPPSPEETAQFLAAWESHPDAAYEALVDRLLKSSRFGERWARPWLDLARYADSNGFQADQLRDSWAYRDWVIRALNANMPYDQFTLEQLAGDLLPGATLDQKVATGFHRTVTCNVEAGVHPEENRVNQVVDRVNTTGTVWLGSTLECAQCHDHKYDPFTMRDYYSVFAYFNNTPLEVSNPSGKGVSFDFSGPFMELPLSEAQKRERASLEKEVSALEKDWAALIAPKEFPANVQAALKKPEARRSLKDRQLLETHFATDPQLKEMNDCLKTARASLAKVSADSTLVMVEMDQPRVTQVMKRGNYLDPGESVQPRTPSFLHAAKETLPPNRLGLARWLMDPENPLVARVAVNRWWAEIFGHGIVATLEDFGTQSEPPTHPELLDWLAVEFAESGWDMQHILRLMVTSATYRQSSRVTPEHLRLDPENRLYARGPRFRMEAEMIRDNALTVSGLLSTRMTGDPIMPYQPPGLWRSVGRNEPKWVEAPDEDRYRRGIYVVYRRAAPYPSFVNFDAPDRASCVVQRSRTNTPLQALTLLNDPAYVEMALGLADRVLRETADAEFEPRLHHAFQLVLQREPASGEREMLRELYESQLSAMTAQRAAAVLRQPGKYLPVPDGTDSTQRAVWLYLSNILLNLDETITKS